MGSENKEFLSELSKTLIDLLKLIKKDQLALRNAVLELVFLVGGVIYLFFGKFFLTGVGFDHKGLLMYLFFVGGGLAWLGLTFWCLSYCVKSMKVK